ncbi:MAG: hypothetical protein ACOC93_05855, partial [Planctomycetota bacterium]
QQGFLSDLNVLWEVSGGELFAGDEVRDELSQVTWNRYSFADLQAFGYDRHSVVADPGFADAAAGDFSLTPDSPAFELGIVAFDAAGAHVG